MTPARLQAVGAVATMVIVLITIALHLPDRTSDWVAVTLARVHEETGARGNLSYSPSKDLLRTLHKPLVDEELPKLCMVARTYAPQFPYLPTFLLSIVHSNMPIHVFLTITEDSAAAMKTVTAITELVNFLVSYNLSSVLPFTSHDTGRIFRDTQDHSASGYAHTDLSIDYLIAYESSCTYAMFTNGDNLYSNSFASEQFLPSMEKGYDVLVCGYVGHAQIRGRRDEEADWDTGTSFVQNPNFQTGHTDLGAAAYKLDFLKLTGQRFMTPQMRKASFLGNYSDVNPYDSLPEELMDEGRQAARVSFDFMTFAADGYFVERTVALTNRTRKIHGHFFFHQ